MKTIQRKSRRKDKGFSLVEVLVGITLVSVAMMGLAQLFMLGIMNNTRADRMTNGTFLALQEVEQIRALTVTEINLLLNAPIDEQLDINLDGIPDYRRITQIQNVGLSYEVRVLVFAQEQMTTGVDTLIADPAAYNVRADMTTLISR